MSGYIGQLISCHTCMTNKYNLTKEVLQEQYSKLGNFKAVSIALEIPRSTIEYQCKKFGITTTPKLVYELDHDFFSHETEEAFYWAGFIAADGCINAHKSIEPNSMTLTLSGTDLSHLELFRNHIKFSGPIKHHISKLSRLNENWNDAHQDRIDIYSKRIISDLKRFAITQRKSLTYELPDWLVVHPLIHHFMRGFNDGDGSFFINKEFRQTKKHGVRVYEKLIFSLRGPENFLKTYKTLLITKANIETVTTPKFGNGTWQLKIAGNNQVGNICKFLYRDAAVYLQRKFDIIKGIL